MEIERRDRLPRKGQSKGARDVNIVEYGRTASIEFEWIIQVECDGWQNSEVDVEYILKIGIAAR